MLELPVKKILIFQSHAITMCQMCINQMLLENGFRVGFSCFVFEHFLAAEAFLVPSIALLNS